MENLEALNVLATEQETRQKDALLAVNAISRAIGKDIPIMPHGEGVGSEPGVYVLDPGLIAGGGIKETSFRFDKKMLSGAANSAHAILPGSLEVKHESGDQSTHKVAAKCTTKRTLQDRLTRTHQEIYTMLDLSARGELALDPVAVVIAPPDIAEGSTVIYTHFKDGLYTFDGYAWGRGLTSDNIDNATLAANAMGKFNANGYEHRDGKIKNVAHEIGGKTGMIDFETTRIIDVTNAASVAGAVHEDLGKLLDSLKTEGLFVARGFASHQTYDQATLVADAVRQICDGYMSAWEGASGEVQMAVIDSVNEVAQKVIDNAVSVSMTV